MVSLCLSYCKDGSSYHSGLTGSYRAGPRFGFRLVPISWCLLSAIHAVKIFPASNWDVNCFMATKLLPYHNIWHFKMEALLSG